jgi:hypothetical protein
MPKEQKDRTKTIQAIGRKEQNGSKPEADDTPNSIGQRQPIKVRAGVAFVLF